MTAVKSFSMFALNLATLGTSLGASISSASAETLRQHYHPRRVEVKERLANQNYRINDDMEYGHSRPGGRRGYTPQTARSATRSASWPA